jgi:hypothetical protein
MIDLIDFKNKTKQNKRKRKKKKRINTLSSLVGLLTLRGFFVTKVKRGKFYSTRTWPDFTLDFVPNSHISNISVH